MEMVHKHDKKSRSSFWSEVKQRASEYLVEVKISQEEDV